VLFKLQFSDGLLEGVMSLGSVCAATPAMSETRFIW
jgi:hypothetical protein